MRNLFPMNVAALIAWPCFWRNKAMQERFLFSDPEYNTYSCPWHNNITAAEASFRTAKALKRNPTSSKQIGDFRWFNSVHFSWTDQQYLDLGLIEPGQWF